MVILASCRPTEPRLTILNEDNVKCQVAVRTKWGSGLGELGYLERENTSDLGPELPNRFQVDEKGNVYVADVFNSRVVEFAPTGQFLRSFEVPLLKGERAFWDVSARGNRIAVAANHRIYVFDSDSHLIQTLEPPPNGRNFAVCEILVGKEVQVDGTGNIYTCIPGGFERGGTVLQFDPGGKSHEFYRGAFTHVVVGWDDLVYIGKEDNSGTVEHPSDGRILVFGPHGKQVSEVIVQGQSLAAAGLYYVGSPVAVDVNRKLYTNVVNVLKDGEAVPQEALIQVSMKGEILRIVRHKQFKLLATDVVDREGKFYMWHFGQIPSEPVVIQRCSP
jgi:hypothetical protein